jgi:hypothetical protein
VAEAVKALEASDILGWGNDISDHGERIAIAQTPISLKVRHPRLYGA